MGKLIKKYCYFLFLSFLLVGCANHPPKPMTLPDGSRGISIDCSKTSYNNCYEQAGELCPSGYDVMVQNKDGGWVYVEGVGGGSTSSKGMLIKCKVAGEEYEKGKKDSAKMDGIQKRMLLVMGMSVIAFLILVISR